MLRLALVILGVLVFLVGGGLALWSVARASPQSSAPQWWSSAIVSLTLLLMGVCVIGALCTRDRRQAAWAGAALAGALYWAVMFTDWFGSDIGSKLVTTKGLAKLEHISRPPSDDPYDVPNYQNGLLSLPMNSIAFDPTGRRLATNNNLGIVGSGRVIRSYSTYNSAALFNASLQNGVGYSLSAFQEIGHYLLIWPLALLAAVLATLIYVRARGSTNAQVNPVGGVPVATDRNVADRSDS